MTDKTENNGTNHLPETEPELEETVSARPSLADGFPGIATGNGDSLFKQTIFNGEELSIGSSMPKVSHWSIAWSDLMMTMFILFLSMFVYQAAHKEFRVSDEIEVIGGDTIEAIEVAGENEASFPFVPIKPGRPLVADEQLRKVEPIHLHDIETDTPFFDETRKGGIDRIKDSLDKAADTEVREGVPDALDKIFAETVPPQRSDSQSQDKTSPLLSETKEDLQINKIFSMNKEDIAELGLDDFASVDLVQDKTMRIILTGDLLFDTGKAILNTPSKSSIQKIAAVIKNSPYMVNVVGHTDNVPMNSERFPTNWELSVARASTVARFLIEEMKMNPNQFVVSGYSSYRPIKPNTNARNRAVNRRVEIIISKRLPAPVAASAENIN